MLIAPPSASLDCSKLREKTREFLPVFTLYAAFGGCRFLKWLFLWFVDPNPVNAPSYFIRLVKMQYSVGDL